MQLYGNHIARNPAVMQGSGASSRLAKLELADAMADLTSNPLVREVNMSPDGSLIVLYPHGVTPAGLRIPPIYPNKLAMIQRAVKVMDSRLSQRAKL